eukprot:gene21846-28876_t
MSATEIGTPASGVQAAAVVAVVQGGVLGRVGVSTDAGALARSAKALDPTPLPVLRPLPLKHCRKDRKMHQASFQLSYDLMTILCGGRPSFLLDYVRVKRDRLAAFLAEVSEVTKAKFCLLSWSDCYIVAVVPLLLKYLTSTEGPSPPEGTLPFVIRFSKHLGVAVAELLPNAEAKLFRDSFECLISELKRVCPYAEDPSHMSGSCSPDAASQAGIAGWCAAVGTLRKSGGSAAPPGRVIVGGGEGLESCDSKARAELVATGWAFGELCAFSFPEEVVTTPLSRTDLSTTGPQTEAEEEGDRQTLRVLVDPQRGETQPAGRGRAELPPRVEARNLLSPRLQAWGEQLSSVLVDSGCWKEVQWTVTNVGMRSVSL